VRSIEKVERVELVREARFRVRINDSTLEALKQLISIASYSFDPITIIMRRGNVCGILEVEIHNADVTVYNVIASEVRPAYDGDEWGEFVYFGDTATVVRIHSKYFLAFNEKLYAFEAEEAEEKLCKFNLVREGW
jgi:hypothetical protein